MGLNINEIVNPLKHFNPEQIILFGSYAYGVPTKESDIDLLVILDTNKSFHERIQEIRPSLPKDKAIDLIVLTPAEYNQTKNTNPLVKEIASRGKVIYG